ncbi:MAG TPA: polysaccharide ABC transporter ATP-binding protein [Verrucomicrobiae bacterium]|nr:polysaccharide ABC transporter ATP-binding protein [Verrucomicrobiae bacterium]
MSEIAVSVEGVCKEFLIGTTPRPTSLRDEIAGGLRNPFRRAVDKTFHALRDVTFSVRQGEIVGICGRNGAGKSTLLKILSRVTEPTRGRARLRGRVSSLLEVGTGFHGDLTGRENIFLNGALLGMRRQEVQARLDEIVAFSDIGKFLDTPVRHYSSGMQARLGFAVAAHLEQEILILDEVLAVGDANFQRKCLERVHTIAGGGKTILMVSHNMQAIERFCHRAVLLVEGQLRDDGLPRGIIDQYYADAEAQVQTAYKEGDEIVVHGSRLTTDAGPGRLRGLIAVTIDLECLREQEHLHCGLGIYNSAGHVLASATAPFGPLPRGKHRLLIELANPGLPPGEYSLSVAVIRRDHWIKLFGRAATFRIPATVTDDPYMLRLQDGHGIALEVRRTETRAPDTSTGGVA